MLARELEKLIFPDILKTGYVIEMKKQNLVSNKVWAHL